MQKILLKLMWLMLQQETAKDYVIATEQQHTVRRFVEQAAPYFGMDIVWRGEGDNEIGIDVNSNEVVVK